ncbi:MAG: luxQ 12 [Verrucomicrobiales bacterium]|nr:luxQ 12 [Verrucomicrobiales bacterium]
MKHDFPESGEKQLPLAAGSGPDSPTGARAPEDEAIRILIVDDEPRNLTALETVLDDPGYRLVRAVSASEALLALVAEDFALLILDVQMPDMNGFELALMIKQRKRSASIPIIFLTAYSSEDQHMQEGYSTGAVDFLHKPISPAILRSKVSVFAELHRRTRESAQANRILMREVAERRRAQEDLRELNEQLERRVSARTAELTVSEARFRALAEEMPHLVWEMDAEGRTTYQNSRSAAYNGPAEHWIHSVHPEDAPRTAAAWAQALASERECDLYCRQRRISDGEYRWFHVKAAPARNPAGAIIRWVGTSTDIHEQRKAEEALRMADRRKDEFLAMLGHELRNPLAAIRHAVRIHADTPGDEATRVWANEVIDRQSTQLTRMVDDLLDVERINRGRIELRFGFVRLESVLSAAVTAVTPLMELRRHRLTAEVPDTGLSIHGDADRLEQVFVNLLTNAAKYTPEGGQIRLSARVENKEAVVSVADNGVGIEPDLLPYVFDLFTQATTSLDRAQGGLGIGLTVVKSLVDMHGGSVAASGGDGGGSVFTVVLPLTASAPVPAVPPPPRPESTSLPRRVRVLIVDDHVDAARTLARLLSRRNCEVHLAHDGPAGVAAAREFHPEVLLLDLGLPGFDGYEVARQLRNEPCCAGALFIAISGYAQESDRHRSAEAGFEYHCAKPVDFATLLTAIRTRLFLNSPEQAAAS